ncbi:hypothetical protein AB0C02_17835 [Micromonospora sp. NPDC048999]|uniref:hypothetical protein n=1 Tax=Micromonospora sp. NPDC048999 TaxID=3155391 RepID=UPI0033D6697C
MTGQLSENQRRYNSLAIVACCMGLVLLLYVSAGLTGLTPLQIDVSIYVLVLGGLPVVVGVVGLKEIKTTGQRGRGLAIAGCVAGASVLAVLAWIFIHLALWVGGWSSGSCGAPAPCW